MTKFSADIDNGLRTTLLARKIARRAGWLVFFLFLFSFSRAQDTPFVKTSIDKTSIVVGEQLRLSMDIRHPAGSALQIPSPDSIPHFEMLGKGTADSLTSGNTTSYHLEWKLTSFDSGINLIPSFPVVIGDRQYLSDSLPVTVSYGGLDSLKEYHDIRGIIDKENPAVKYIVWIIAGLTLLGIILFVWFITRQTPQSLYAEETPRKSSASALQEAMTALDALKKMPLTDAAAVKKYYSGMNDVLRVFLGRNMGLSAMARTNEELIMQISRMDMNKEAFSRLTGTLRMSDFVKFAKYTPDVFDNERNLDVIRTSIEIINEIRK